jgi:hypothetical protein
MIYVGALLLGLIYLAITLSQKGTVGPMVAQMEGWMRDHQPYSYILVGTLVFASILSVALMYWWPKNKGPANPMEKYRNRRDVLED